jgi:hypothetical protein
MVLSVAWIGAMALPASAMAARIILEAMTNLPWFRPS